MVNDLLNKDLSNFSCNNNDEELAKCAKDNRLAVNELVLRYSKLIYRKSDVYAGCGLDRDDLYQEGLIGLLSAINSYNPEKGAKFSAFASVCIDNRMKTLLLKSKKNASIVANIDEISEDCFVYDEVTPESVYLYKEYFSELFNVINSVLSTAELRIFKLCIQGLPYRAVAKKLNISEKSVDNAMQRARRKIRSLVQERAIYQK